MENMQTDKNPWGGLLIPVAWGVLLQAIGLNFLMLQYILPTIGVILVYVGIRELRGVNHWFGVAWYFAVFSLLLWGLILILMATPLALSIAEGKEMNIFAFLSLMKALSLIGFLLTLRMGIQTFFKSSGIVQPARILLWFAVWIVMVNLLGIIFTVARVDGENWIVAVSVLAGYIFLGVSTVKLGDRLDNTECVPTYTQAKFLGSLLGICYFGGLALIIVCISIFVNHPVIQGEKLASSPDDMVRAELVNKGVPQEIAEVLSKESLEYLKNTKKVVVRQENLTRSQTQVDTASGPYELFVASIYLQDAEENVYMLEYFELNRWKAIWNDGIVIWGDGTLTLLDGKLIYDSQGEIHSADLLRKAQGSYQFASSSFFGETNVQGITAGVSFPFGTDNHSGYVLAEATIPDKLPEYVQFHYGHFLTPLRYPYNDPEKMMLAGSKQSMIHYANFID